MATVKKIYAGITLAALSPMRPGKPLPDATKSSDMLFKVKRKVKAKPSKRRK